ncbi:MAG: SDR family NAD(P)-dependent oxidoreductase [Desulfobacterales bacterium]|nr:SDR family NAD(P)-dependent oxidoreductase [Desulfobacterales bacterium]
MLGITSYGAYLPRLRLRRAAIVQHMGWFAPAIMAVAQGERAMCNWDEDSLTMAVAAARDCLTGRDRSDLDALYLASTTLPFADRQNAGILAAALNLDARILTADFSAALKAGTTALITALEAIQGGERRNILVAAADARQTKTACFHEMWFGDGAAAFSLGNDNVIAAYKGSHTISCDFVDHYRGADRRFDYMWEERWVRDAGYRRIIPETVNGLLDKLGRAAKDVDHLVFPCFFKAEHRRIAKALGVAPENVIDNLHDVCGETGAAHPFLMMAAALDRARPGDMIVMAGFGQGCNALCFEITPAIAELPVRNRFEGALAARETTDNYLKFLKFRDLIQTEMGIRAEAPTQTATTVLWRKNAMILGLVGGRCEVCGTPQFPRADICVNPECGALHTQEDHPFADVPARVKTFTGDMLAVSVDPPAIYGMVQFEGGGRMTVDFTDCRLEDLRVGLPVRMVFKRKGVDPERGFSNYFWKAVPQPSTESGDEIRFDGRVAIVTGAGGGLGRAYALELARRGAQVVVNDLGGARDGAGAGSASPAEAVVAEIEAAGGAAVASFDNVATAEGGAAIVQTAVEAFGTVDIVINNAGILRDKSFVKMTPENWQAVLDVHLSGAYHVTRPAFEVMKARGYGRVVMTTSAAGLYGNFGQTNYSAAKLGLVGLMNTLKLEGARYGIRVNTIAPLAASRLTEDVMPPDLFAKMKPEFVVPLVVFLCSAECAASGQVFNAGMGYFNRAAVVTGRGVQPGDGDRPPDLEAIQAHWDQINDLAGAAEMTDAMAALMDLVAPPPAAGAEAPAAAETPDVAAVFAAMPDAFDPEAAAGVEAVFQYVISGSGGGDWQVAVRDRACKVKPGWAEQPTCTLIIAAPDFLDMITGRLDPMQAFTTGKLKIEGDVMASQLIGKLFRVQP